MTEFEFEGLATKHVTKQLVAQADAKDGFFANELLELVMDVAERGRISRSVG